MKQVNSPIIKVIDLLNLLKTEKIVLIDATNAPNAKLDYTKSHLQGALFVDINNDLADIKEDVSQGGRHPLPPIDQFAALISSLGISKTSNVVVYDASNGSNAAARFWWMLKAAGHDKVQVLDGGMQEAIRCGFPTSEGEEYAHEAPPYLIENWLLPIADMNQVAMAAKSDKHLVIDVRAANRYAGLTEPIDPIAGHIPGAINVPFEENLNPEGLFLSPAMLKEKYEKILSDTAADQTIIHCGSGVTACHTILAIAYAGLEIPTLYVGSWSEWCRNGMEIGTGQI